MSLPSLTSANGTRANTSAPSPQPPSSEFQNNYHNSSPLDPDGFIAGNDTPSFDDDDLDMFIDYTPTITEQYIDTDGTERTRPHALGDMTVPSVSIIPETPGIFTGTLGFGSNEGSTVPDGSLPSAPGFSTVFDGADSAINEQHAWLSVGQVAPSRVHSAPGSVILDGNDDEPTSTGMERSNSLQDAGDRHKPRRKLDRKATIDMGNNSVLDLSVNEAHAAKEMKEKNQQVENWIRRLSEPETPKTDGFLHVTEKGSRSRRSRSLSGFTADFSFSLHGRKERQASTVSAHLAPDELHNDQAPTSAPLTSNNLNAEAEADEEDDIPRPLPAGAGREHIFRYPKPWKDGIHLNTGESAQPATANDAMIKYELMSKNIETASRVATFGSRRMSLNDMEQFLQDPEELRRLKLRSDTTRSEEKEDLRKRMKDSLAHLKRGGSIRSQHSVNSVGSSGSGPSSPTLPREKSHRFSGGLSHVKDKLRSLRTPKLDTASALTSMATASTAVGSATVHRSLSRRRRGESEQSEVSQPGRFRKHRLSPTPGSNGESMISLLKGKSASPAHPMSSPPENGTPSTTYSAPNSAYPNDTDSSLHSAHDSRKNSDDSFDKAAPTYESFTEEVLVSYPNLEPWLVDRIASEQCKRYKTLLDYRKKHEAAVRAGGGRCANGDKCLGENPSYVEQHEKSVSTVESGFGTARSSQQDDDEDDNGDFTLPAGIPVPPVTSFTNPVTFECPICFKLKKFQKPSDWSKHVHEDLQPFTCTYKACTNPRADAKAEPKSFKRKADWVRHENEKHRKLEWWTCVLQDCTHICYRRDNFLQHLVREHRMSDPKQKQQRKIGFPQDTPESDRTNQLVNDCRKETNRQPTQEPCLFCGQTSNEWKKLHQHLGTHMEQLALPVLELVMGRVPLRKLSEAEERQKQDSIDAGRIRPSFRSPQNSQNSVKLETAHPGIGRSNTSNSSMSPLTGSPFPQTSMDGFNITTAPTSMPSNMQTLTNHMMAARVSTTINSHPLPLSYNSQHQSPIYAHPPLPMTTSGYPSQQLNTTSMSNDYSHIPVSQGGNQFHSPVGYMPLGGMPNGMQVSNADMQFPIYPTAGYGVPGSVSGDFLPDMGMGSNAMGQHQPVNGYTMEQESMEHWPGNGY
ncbi:hypothetical protein BJ508DRAFT_335422 [Ascobolus immersus RN42]|uniref:C2H2-type domain-containing protein n=1 Tax=Ascobolus immersus RN42 TaxID=1160509 RepID=A0A3N4HEM2_ASCIM|nr:hypothetical protein BJ508DRAFT_335422 [Ascobolus immersus RN42]